VAGNRHTAPVDAIVVVVNRVVILPEARYLEPKCGDVYLTYRRPARRWL
jgi:protein-S-isoprenylcysteine O-methyltransferase Ste14